MANEEPEVNVEAIVALGLVGLAVVGGAVALALHARSDVRRFDALDLRLDRVDQRSRAVGLELVNMFEDLAGQNLLSPRTVHEIGLSLARRDLTHADILQRAGISEPALGLHEAARAAQRALR